MPHHLIKSSIFIFAALLAASTSIAQTKTVTIALEGAYKPWNLTNSDGTLGGFEPALAKVICERAKLDCKLITAEWDSMIPSLNAGKFDVIMDAMSITAKRKEVINFSVPYASTRSRFVASTSFAAELKDLADSEVVLASTAKTGGGELDALRTAFKGKVIGIQAATHYGAFVRENFGDVAEIREYKKGQERDIDLQNGRIDLIIDNTVYLTTAIETASGALAFVGPTISGPIWGEGVGLGLRKSDDDLRAALDSAIKSTRDDGTLTKLSLEFLKTDVTPK